MPLPTNDKAQNMFHAAAVAGNPKVVAKLIAAHKRHVPSALLARDSSGQTPAHLAAQSGNLRALKILVDACSESLFVRDSKQLNVLDILRHDDSPYTFQLCTRLLAWGPASIGESHSLTSLSPPELPGKGVERFAPRSVVKMAVSGTQALVVCQKRFDRYAFSTKNLTYTNIEGKVMGASTALHSVIVTDKAAFTWGQNSHGQLGQDVKSCAKPTQLDKFLEYKRSSLGGFEALAQSHERVPLEPLVDTECTTHYSVAWTTKRLYGWGLNSGQFINQPAGRCQVSLLHTFRSSIDTVVCLDNAILVLSGGTVVAFTRGDMQTLNYTGSDIKGRGRFFVIKNNQGRLQFFHLSKPDEYVKIPTPKSEPVVSFDVTEGGMVVIATQFTVYTWQKGQDIVEVPGSSRSDIRKVCCDSRGASFMAVQEYYLPSETLVYGTHLAEDLAKLCPVNTQFEPSEPQEFSAFEDLGDFETTQFHFDWDTLPGVQARNDSEVVLEVDSGSSIQVHRSILFGRCPRLDTEKLVSTRGGCTIERDGDKLTFHNVSFESLTAFVHYVYTEAPKDSPPNTLGKQYRDLQSLVDGSLSIGMLRSKGVTPDVTIELSNGEVSAHSYILRSRSEYFDARLREPWRSERVDLTQYSVTAFTLFMDFLYSGKASQILWNVRGNEDEVTNTLVELWYLADELMHSQVMNIVENALTGFLNLDSCVDILSGLPGSKALQSRSLEFCGRHMDYYIRNLTSMPNYVVDKVESYYKKLYGASMDMDSPAELVTKLTPSVASSQATKSADTTDNIRSLKEKDTMKSPDSISRSVTPNTSDAVTPKAKSAQKVVSAVGIASPAKPVDMPKPVPVTSQAPWAQSRTRSPVARAIGSSTPVPMTRPISKASSPLPPSSLPSLGQTSLASPSPRLGSPQSNPSSRPRTPSVPKVSRLSQKERKKLEREQLNSQNQEQPSSSAAPWTRPTATTNSLSEQIAVLHRDRQRKTRVGS